MSSTENIVEKKDDVEEDEKKTSFHLQNLTPGVVLAVLTGYFAWATYYYIDKTDEQLGDTCCTGYGFLMILFIFTAYGFFYSYLFTPFLARSFRDVVWKPFRGTIANLFQKKIAIWIAYAVIFAAMIVYLVLDAWNDKQRLIPMAGLAFFLLFGFIFSKNRAEINWHIIIRGIILQFVFGLITLRWETGQNIFKCAGDKVTTFLGYAKNGSAFVYGNMLVMDEATKVFAFEAISTIYFLAFVINILYHIGVMQKIVINLGLFLHYVMGTSICESVNSAANIFLGQTEAPLLLKPYLPSLTSSEIHTVMTSGFASVSGTVLAAYISYGAKASHLITASVMAAPAGLLFSKMMLPETEKTTQAKELVELAKSEFVSVLDAASKGASDATYIILGIIANLIAFIASVFFINGVLGWLGMLVGFTSPEDTWSIELIMGYIFTPISFLMGVPWDECQDVGKLIGLKTMVNEFAAFQQFKTLELSPRTRIIATFAICGFANPGSIGIMISALGTLIPNKNEVVTSNVFRAFVSGSIVCFTTACIAGMLSSAEQIS